MPDLKTFKKSEILVEGPSRPNRSRGAAVLSRGSFTDAQLELAGSRGSVGIGAATLYDFCGTNNWCTTHTTTCPQIAPAGPAP